MGYSVAVAFQLSIVVYVIDFISFFTSFAIGSYLFSLTIMKEIKEKLDTYNGNIRMKPSQADLLKEFSEAIRFTHFKQLVETEDH